MLKYIIIISLITITNISCHIEKEPITNQQYNKVSNSVDSKEHKNIDKVKILNDSAMAIFYNITRIHRQDASYGESIDLLTRAIKLDSTNYLTYSNLIIIYGWKKEKQKINNILMLAKNYCEPNPELYLALGLSYYKNNYPDSSDYFLTKSFDLFEKRSKSSNKHETIIITAKIMMSIILLFIENENKALSYYNEIKREYPNFEYYKIYDDYFTNVNKTKEIFLSPF